MEAEDVEVLFLAPSADLEYLTGIERQIPNFGEASYANGWVTGAFFTPKSNPVFLFPRMFAAFDIREDPEGEIVVVNETDDGFGMFERVARGLGSNGTVAVGDRVWAETTLNLGRVLGFDRLRTGSTLVNELRRVKTPEELEAMGRAIRTVEEAMGAVTARRWPNWPSRSSTNCARRGHAQPPSPHTSSPAWATASSTRPPRPRMNRCRKERR